jgi:Cft2 family RNA processing exonuclease
MQLTFLGGADEVGASSTLIEIAGKLLLVDAGIRISPRSNRGIQNDQLPDLRRISEAGGPDYILVTHAHTDHTGALPLVVEQYPHVPVLATRPTADLIRILQADAQRIMHSRQEEEGELPLFDEIAVERLLNAFQPVEFRQPVRLGDGLQVMFHPAGHIAGAALIVVESEEGILALSGDLSLSDQRAVMNAVLPNLKVDALVLESTYGGKLHANRVAEEKRLIDTLRQITERGGKALVPAFALGRAQEVLQIILAHRDQLDVPVYADGMVRAVCRAYVTFPDYLPGRIVQAAGDEHLFFRSKIRSVDSAALRDDVIHSDSPAVIVASSGMLTGGASVIYAKHLAGDPRNAILLTGYQDEESPGRFLQRLAAQREAGEEAVLRIENEAVTVRCEIGTYSLSAHADEAELVSLSEALGAEDVLLVHGDPGARHSLATALRQREKHVQTPTIGQTIALAFAPRPWAMGQIASGSESRPLDAAELWDALQSHAGNFFSAAELARMWWGDASRSREVIASLSADELYFAADWRRRDTFCVRTPDQVAAVQRRRAIMLAHPALVGQCIVLRDSNNRTRIGIVINASIDAFEAIVHNTKGRHYPADALVWAVAPWDHFPADEAGNRSLSTVAPQAKALQDIVLPLDVRQQLAAQDQPVDPVRLLPSMLPAGATREIALLAVAVALADDGAVWEPEGLHPRRARQREPLEMNQARETALAAFPVEARLRKVGMEAPRRRMVLTFDFPATAADRYAAEIEQVMDMTGWDVIVNPQVNQLALGSAIGELLPPQVRILKGPSFHIDRREVQLEIDEPSEEIDLHEIERSYAELTSFRLVLKRRGEPSSQPAQPAPAAPLTGARQMEINAAYDVIREVLGEHGLYKTSLKQGQIVLSFISPQVGERYYETINQLAEQTGYALSIHPNPNQQQILQIAQQLIHEAGWQIRKGPGIHVDRAEVSVALASEVDPAAAAWVEESFEQQTGYRLVLNP